MQKNPTSSCVMCMVSLRYEHMNDRHHNERFSYVPLQKQYCFVAKEALLNSIFPSECFPPELHSKYT